MSLSIEYLIRDLLEEGCSDVFFESTKPLRYRLNGVIGISVDTIITEAQMRDFWEACGCDPESDSEYDIRYQLPDSDSFLRVNFFRSLGRLAAALRPVNVHISTLEALGMPAHKLMPWFMRESGLILATGAAGATGAAIGGAAAVAIRAGGGLVSLIVRKSGIGTTCTRGVLGSFVVPSCWLIQLRPARLEMLSFICFTLFIFCVYFCGLVVFAQLFKQVFVFHSRDGTGRRH